MTAVLEVTGLDVRIGGREIVRDISLQVGREQTLGIVGESGSGKSMTVLAATGLLDAPGARVDGSSVLAGQQELIGAPAKVLRHVHGGRIGFVFQDPGTSLNPLLTIERQITESVQTHRGATRRAARARALELLTAVGLPDPENRLNSYPHQLSGGQKQRVMVAIALACDPELLVADEPTTALDVTTQAQIIELVRNLQRDFGTAVIWISHDLGVIGQVADDVTVLREGRVVEQAPVLDVFDRPQHEYTRELLAARPVLSTTPKGTFGRDTPGEIGRKVPFGEQGEGEVLLDVADLSVSFPLRTASGTSTIHAVRDLTFQIRRGATLGLVGESGSGKSTVAAALTGQVRPDTGTAHLDRTDLFDVPRRERKAVRRRISLVFQDPYSALDPRTTVGGAIGEPLRGISARSVSPSDGNRAEITRRRIAELLEMVGLSADFASRYPHELSGGQRQRVNIARALAVEPDLVILDEATASLDVSVQAKVLDLIAELQRELGLTFLFIGHDLAVIEQVSNDVLVMRDGVCVENRPAAELFAAPENEYTRELLAAVPPARPRVG